MCGTAVDEPVPHRIDVHAEFPHQCENCGNRRCAVKLSLRLVLGPTATIADRERGVGLPEPIDSAFQKPLLVAGCQFVQGDLQRRRPAIDAEDAPSIS